MAGSLEPLSDVANRYMAQFHSTAETVRHRGSNIKADTEVLVTEAKSRLEALRRDVEPQVRDLQAEVTLALKDTTSLENSDTRKFLLESYLWTAVCLVGLATGQILGRHILHPILGLFFHKWMTFCLAYVVLPLWFFVYNKENPEVKEEERRMTLFGISILLGILTGFNQAQLYLTFFSPPAVILPIAIALGSGLMKSGITAERRIFLASTVGAATGIYFLFGIILRSLGICYIFWVLLTGVVAILNLQIQLGRIQGGKADAVLVQFSTVLTSLFLQALLTRIFGTTAEKAARRKS